MAITPDFRTYTGATRTAETAAVLDTGLRSYMLRVYNWMTSGLLISGIVSG
jgi:FtsH-binding integral membrane protein